MIGAVPFQSALLMTGYGAGKQYSPDGSLWGVFLGGCTGGMVQSFFMSPVELIKVQSQVKLGRGQPIDAAPWNKGLTATLLRDGIPHGVWFVSYELSKDYLSKRLGERHEDYTVPLLSGAFAATAAWVRHSKLLFALHENHSDLHPFLYSLY